MRFFSYLRWVGLGVRDDSRRVREGLSARPARKLPGTEVLGLVALFGAIDAVDPLRHSDAGSGPSAAARSALNGAIPPADSGASRSTFAIHWEPMDREGNLVRDFYLSDGWVRIPMDRSAT
jgi:hypothetical protein